MTVWKRMTVAVGVFLAGCSPSGQEPSHTARVIEPAHVEILPVQAQFTHVREMVVARGSIWVLDAAPPYVTRVPLGGGPVVRFGKKGPGPGEFTFPLAIQPTFGGAGAMVWDLGTRRVSEFDPDGRLVEATGLSEEGSPRPRTDIDEVSYVDPVRFRVTDSEIIAARFPGRFNRTADMMSGILFRSDPGLQPGPAMARLAEYADPSPASLKEWSEVPLWDACDGQVVVWVPDGQELRWLELDGTARSSVSLDVRRKPVTEADIEGYLRRMARLELGPAYEKAGISFAREARNSRDRFADRQPTATDVRCEAAGTAWIRLFSTETDPVGRSQAWLRISEEQWTRRHRFPPGFTPLAFKPGIVFGVVETRQGHQALARWTMAHVAEPAQ